MGQGYLIKCEACGYEKNIMVGCGMAYHDFDLMFPGLPAHIKKEVKEIQSKYKIEKAVFSEVFLVCDKCNMFKNELHISFIYNNGQVYESTSKCRKCKGVMRDHDIYNEEDETDFLEFNCPKCGEKKLTAQRNILWD